MTTGTIPTAGFAVDASVIATAFGIDPATLQTRMRAGEVTSLCEAGVDADFGHFRLTFRHAGQALQLTVNADGKVLAQVMYPVGVTKTNRIPPAG